jgi:hypothetical protein
VKWEVLEPGDRLPSCGLVLAGFETLRVIYCCEKDLSYCDAVLAYLLCPLCCPTYFACGCICPDAAINASNPQKVWQKAPVEFLPLLYGLGCTPHSGWV